jgi:hypothetical protein
MKIELRKLKIVESMSEETTAFTADIYIEGYKSGYAKNDGQGGCTFYHAYEVRRDLIKQAEAYCLGLPAKDYGSFKLPMNLEHFIDNIVDETLQAKEQAKFNKKLQKDMLKGVCVKTEMGYSLMTWKGFTLEQLLSNPKGRTAVYQRIRELKAEGKEVLNTNVPSNL